MVMVKCFCGHREGRHKSSHGGCKQCSCTRFRDFILNGQTVRHAAGKARLSPAMVSRFLNLERNLSPAAFTRLARAVGRTREDMYTTMLARGFNG